MNNMGNQFDSRYWGGGKFPDPFFDIASQYMPKDIKRTFAWCEYLYFTNGIVRAATERIVQYFVTELQYKNNDTDNVRKLKNILEKQLKIKNVALMMANNFLVYGNSIATIYFPFRRVLKCPVCGLEVDIHNLAYKYSDLQYSGTCPCGKLVKFTAVDHKDFDTKNINIIHLDPKNMDINYNPFSGRSEYYWTIPNNVITEIKSQNKFMIESTPPEILQAVQEGKTFKFDNAYIIHMKQPTLSGVQVEWGLPFFINILKLNYYAALLRRANEAIALDFVVPFRILSPGHSSPNADPVAMASLSNFVSEMQSMVFRHRNDPADIQIAPFPIAYQAFGGEKKSLDLTNEIKSIIEEQLHSLNYPSELFYNTLRLQSYPPALRLFENTWSHLVEGLNTFVQWVADHICDHMGMQRETVSFTRVTIADDIEKRQVLLQLASSQQISMISALKAYGLDFEEEQRQMAEQQKIMSTIQQDMQEEAQVAQQMGQGQQPADSSPMDVQSQGQQLAMNMLSMPQEQRRIQLNQMNQMNPTLYAIVKDKMEKIRSTSQTQQGYQTLQQMGMGGATGGQPPAGPPQ